MATAANRTTPLPTAYSLHARASDVVTVLDDLGILTADFMGYSMGGWIGFGLARNAPERFRSLILGGAHPFAEDMTAFRAMLPKTPDAFVAMVEPVFGAYLLPGMRERMVSNDLTALAALTTDREDLSAVLPTIRMPCLLYVGTQDPRLPRVRDCVGQLPNATFFTMEDCTHVAGFGRINLVLPRVSAFLAANRS